MGSRGRTSRFIVAAVIGLGGTLGAAPVATAAESNCDKTPVHRLVCDAVDPGTIEKVRELLCAAAEDLCT